MKNARFSTVIIGAGQAGLAAAYYLKKTDHDFILLDEGERIGDSWRQRWDSLKLFTPSQHDALTGFPFPAHRGTFPTRDEMADYLSEYADRFSLPVQLGTKVNELRKTPDGYEITTSKGNIYSDHVIVCTGTNPSAYIPAFASELDKKIVQIHSSNYKNPGQLPASDTLVVGAGTSGAEIAVELSRSRPTMISGKATPHIPDIAFRYAGPVFWWFIHHILTLRTPVGRKARLKIINGGAPLISVSMEDVKEAKVQHVPRLKGAEKGMPILEDGRILKVSSIVWATGYRPDFSWIKLDVTDHIGWPRTNRGVSGEWRGLYFVGMKFQYGLTSGLVGGVSRDAAFVVHHLKRHSRYEMVSK